MQASTIHRRLWWKEARQLLPLVILLPLTVLVIVLLMALPALISHSGWGVMDRLASALAGLALGIPGLYAVGVGGLLVGQEKESRSIEWLSSLPIPPGRIVWVKLLIGLAGLAVLWCICIPIASFGDGMAIVSILDVVGLISWVLYSAFLLSAGVAIAWRVQNTWLSLVCVIPVAVIALIVVGLSSGSDQMFGLGSQSSPISQPFVLAGMVVLAGWLAIREGYRALRPRSPSGGVATFLDRGFSSEIPVVVARPLKAPYPALLWQFARQNRLVLIGILAMLGVSAILSLLMFRQASIEEASRLLNRGSVTQFYLGVWANPLAILLAIAGVSWLGILVFQSDSSVHRIRFLADRGISPSAVWSSRQAIPAAIVSAFALSALLLFVFLWNVSTEALLDFGVPFAALIGLLLVGYLATQWFGQTISSPVISAIGAPLIFLFFVSFNLFCLGFLESPLWLQIVVNLIPLAATRAMTRRWMDRRLGIDYYGRHACWLVAYLLIPAIPLMITAFRLPSMPDSIAREIETTRQTMRRSAGMKELVLFPESIKPETESQEQSPVTQPRRPLPEAQQKIIAGIKDQLNSIGDQAVSSASLRVINFLTGYAELTRRSLADDSNADRTIEDYRKAVRLIAEITDRLRRSPRLVEQDLADYQEIWLLKELEREQAVDLLGGDLYASIAKQIGDPILRRSHRQQALADSWRRFQQDPLASELGGHSLYHSEIGSGGRLWLSRKRLASTAVADLWLLSSGDPSKATPELLQSIAQFWGRPPEAYGLGVSGIALRADDLSQFTRTNVEGSFLRTPAAQWSAGWERRAQQLSQNLDARLAQPAPGGDDDN
jgi:ABC-type transport system involved in multi-copper enzyme maturation permease subunit